MRLTSHFRRRQEIPPRLYACAFYYPGSDILEKSANGFCCPKEVTPVISAALSTFSKKSCPLQKRLPYFLARVFLSSTYEYIYNAFTEDLSQRHSTVGNPHLHLLPQHSIDGPPRYGFFVYQQGDNILQQRSQQRKTQTYRNGRWHGNLQKIL